MVKAKKVNYEKAWYALAVARIFLGFIFLWAFLDKTIGLGYATPHDKAWLLGGSPTAGFLTHVSGLFADMFHVMAGNVLVDWMFMLGLLGIGLALILGIGLRIAAVAGTLLLVMMWLAVFPTKGVSNNPLIDEHLVYMAMLWVFAYGVRKISLFDAWTQADYVKKNTWLW